MDNKEEGVSAPKLRSMIYNYQQYLATLPDLLIESLTINRIDSTTEEIQITISREIEDYENGILRCYISNTESEIENPENEILLIIDTENSYNGTCVLAEGIFYVLAVYENLEGYRITESFSEYHYSIDQLTPTIIDIPLGGFYNDGKPPYCFF